MAAALTARDAFQTPYASQITSHCQ
jgi:hypothetical protein